MTVFPYSRMKSIDKTIFFFINTLDSIINTARHEKYICIDDLKEELTYIKNEINLCHNELVFSKKKKARLHELENHYKMAKEVFFQLEVCQTIDVEKDKDIFDYHLGKATSTYYKYINDFKPWG